MDLVPGDVISDYIAFTGSYDIELTRFIMQRAARGGLLVDVGANLGYFTLLWLAQRPSNRCIAFEASPRNTTLLRRNLDQSQVSARVQLHCCGAGAAPGCLQFDPGPADQTGWGGFSSDTRESLIQVDVVRLDQVIPADQAVALLKVDVEGADTWVLHGCEQLLRRKQIAELRYEQNRPRMQALGIREGDAPRFLENLGYRVRAVTNGNALVSDWIATPA
jgi:FkbM family methyltransferase